MTQCLNHVILQPGEPFPVCSSLNCMLLLAFYLLLACLFLQTYSALAATDLGSDSEDLFSSSSSLAPSCAYSLTDSVKQLWLDRLTISYLSNLHHLRSLLPSGTIQIGPTIGAARLYVGSLPFKKPFLRDSFKTDPNTSSDRQLRNQKDATVTSDDVTEPAIEPEDFVIAAFSAPGFMAFIEKRFAILFVSHLKRRKSSMQTSECHMRRTGSLVFGGLLCN